MMFSWVLNLPSVLYSPRITWRRWWEVWLSHLSVMKQQKVQLGLIWNCDLDMDSIGVSFTARPVVACPLRWCLWTRGTACRESPYQHPTCPGLWLDSRGHGKEDVTALGKKGTQAVQWALFFHRFSVETLISLVLFSCQDSRHSWNWLWSPDSEGCACAKTPEAGVWNSK